MVNNSTNVKNTNNHLSPSFTSNTKKTTACGIRNPGPCLGQTQKYDEVNLFKGTLAF